MATCLYSQQRVTSINIELANKAYIYLFIALKFTIKSTIKSYIETDLFAYNMATAIVLQYTSTVFMGIIIDIGTLYKFMASYSQF